MFRGQFTHSIDKKGRVSLPARFREALQADEARSFILTPYPFDQCLQLYPMGAWEQFEQKISDLPEFDPTMQRFRRLYVSAAVECELDRAGRVLVTQELRQRADLVKDVVWAGMGRVIELWSKERWDEALSMTAEQLEEFKRAVTEQFKI